MSSSGITALNSGPLIIRTYNNISSSNNTYILKDYDYPVSSNYILITSTNGILSPSNNIYVSSISNYSSISEYATNSTLNVSTIYAINSTISIENQVHIYNNPNGGPSLIVDGSSIFEYATISTSYLSTVQSINSTITFENQVNIDANPNSGPSLIVNGSTIFTEPGAQSTTTSAGVTIWGLADGNPINQNFNSTNTYIINDPISKINFQLIASGGASTFSNQNITNEDLPGCGTYISGTLAVKMGDKLQFTIGTLGITTNGSKGTSLVYYSSIGSNNFISTLVCSAGAGGGNGWSPDLISSSSGGGHGGGGAGAIKTGGNTDYIVSGTIGYDGISSINGSYQSITDGGQGGQINLGGLGGNGNPPSGPPGSNGNSGGSPNLGNLSISGGLTDGGGGGNATYTGGWGGGGYTGGGGGGASIYTSAGGGGGSSYIATSTLSSMLSNVVCLGGQWISQYNSAPFGQDYGLPNNPGFASITGYQPNDTLYTNGDIQCRVLRYSMLDPPINAIGGAAALWALYPAIDIVNMNDNPIVECGGLEIDSGGADITGNSIFRNQLSTLDKVTVTSGGINVTGNSLFNNQVSTLDKVTVTSGGINVTGNSLFNNQVSTLDKVSVTNGGINVTGNSLFNNQVTVTSGGINVTGNSLFNNQVSTLDKVTVTSGGINVIGNSLFNNQLTVTSGGINVTGSSLFNNQVSTLDKLTVTNSGINVTGNSLFNNQLTVTSGGINVTGSSLFNNQVSTLDKLTVTNSGINVTGNSLFNNQLTVTNGIINGLSSIYASTFVSSNNIYMNNGVLNMNNGTNTGQIIGLSTINGQIYPPDDDAFWSKLGNNIYNDNTGYNVGINITIPNFTLDVQGDIHSSGFISTNTLYASTINMNSTATILYKNFNPNNVPNTYYYKYWVKYQTNIDGANNLQDPYRNWTSGSYITMSSINAYNATLLSSSDRIWICPKSGLWTVHTYINVPAIQDSNGNYALVNESAVVTGNLTRNELITSNGSSATVFIANGEQVTTAAFYIRQGMTQSNVGDNNDISNVSFRLIMPLEITV
jgi:hypothetical protein